MLDALNRFTDASYTDGTSESFAYDPQGNRITATDRDGDTTTYTDGTSESFGYDAQGNRVEATDRDGDTTTYTVDPTGQLVSDSDGTTYTYDNTGNLVATSLGDAYEWDAYGRLIETTVDGGVETYGYDAASVRTLVGADQQLWDRSGLPTLINDGTNSYVHDPSGVLRSGDDWLLADAVGSVRAATSDTGTVTNTSAFTAFGEPISGGDTFGFAGEQLDSTGLIHLRARQLDPALGRFLSVDPIQPGGPSTTGWNHYTYSGANPTTWTDPTGEITLTSESIVLAGGAAIVAYAVLVTSPGYQQAIQPAIDCLGEGLNCVGISFASAGDDRTGAGRGDPHARPAPPSVRAQLEEAEAALAELISRQGPRRDRVKLENLIRRLRQKIEQAPKGETHGRQGF